MNKSGILPALLLALITGAGGYWLAIQSNSSGSQDSAAGEAAETAILSKSLPYQSGPFRFDISVQPEAPVVGENILTLKLTDASGEPVRNAQIRAVAEMAAMGAMPAMPAPADMTEIASGVYEGSFEPRMKGAWPLSVEVAKEGLGETRFSFDMATGRKGLRPASGLSRADGGSTDSARLPAGTITVDARRRQLIGVTFGEAKRRALSRDLRAVGQVTYDETRLIDVSLKYDVWVGELEADYVGKPVKRGQLLFTIYSPALYSAQQEYLDIRRRADAGPLLAAARQRLKLWDLADSTIEALIERGTPFEYVPVYAPASGTLVEKNIVAGTAQQAGATLLRIADLSQVWVEAAVYESELPLVEIGQRADVTLPYLPGLSFTARIDYIYPTLDADTRTGRIRLTLPNNAGSLKPGMYAEVTLEIPLGERLSVPSEAVLVAGETRVVFEDLGDGRLAPRRVKTGQRTKDYVEILEGLAAGARVVTSGNFLIASESNLKAAIEQW